MAFDGGISGAVDIFALLVEKRSFYFVPFHWSGKKCTTCTFDEISLAVFLPFTASIKKLERGLR